MKVELAEKCGFCFGVKRAIEHARGVLLKGFGGPGGDADANTENAAGATGRIFTLGELIHNRQVVDRLAGQGLGVLDDPAAAQPGDTVIIRSHGAPPEVFEMLTRRGATIVDATCVLVKKAQEIVAELDREGYQVVVVGDENHPEVRGVISYGRNVICVDSPEQLHRLPASGRLGIISQTTHLPEHFGRMVGLIAAMGFGELKVVNTLCGETRRRQESSVSLARRVEVMFVLGGRQSANTRHLAELCRSTGTETFHLESFDDFRAEMAAGRSIAGVTAGASTPEWIIEDFVERLSAFA